jgi:hypothetical protein
MPRYGEADPKIVEARFDVSRFNNRAEADIEVDIRDNSSSGGSSGKNALYCLATSDSLSQPIIMKCIIISPGETITIDDSSGLVEGYDGSFPLTKGTVQVQVLVGGYVAGTECRPSNFDINTHDDEVLAEVVAPTAETSEEVDPTLTRISTDKQSYVVGETVTIEAEVQNNSGAGNLDIRGGLKDTGSDLPNIESGDALVFDGSGTKTATIQIDIPQTGPKFDQALAYIQSRPEGQITTPVTISPESGSVLDYAKVEIPNIEAFPQRARVNYTVENTFASVIEVDLSFSPGNETRTVQVGSGQLTGDIIEYDMNNQEAQDMEFCVNKEDVRIL